MPAQTKTALFGSGSMYAIVGGKAIKVGCLQNIEIDYSVDIKMLYGQNKFPDAVAQGQAKLSGKGKTGFFDINLFTALFTNQSLDPSGYEKVQELEAKVVPAAAPFTAQVANAATFTGDLGVFYAATGVQLVAVAAGAEAAGKYSFNAATGVYTFAAADANAAVLISYSFNSVNGNQILVQNSLTGTQTVFQMLLQEGLTGANGRSSVSLRLYQCVASKINFPFKNDDFGVQDFEFMCFADPNTGNVFRYGQGV